MGQDSRFECVANVSEGRDGAIINALAAACGGTLLDVHSDADHHRTVLTLGGPLDAVEDGGRRLAEAAVASIDMRSHRGVHPCVGGLDVVPFVALDPREAPAAADAARRFAAWLAHELGVPAFLYGDADPEGRSLPDLRRDAFKTRDPDFGPRAPHPTAGASAVGAREVLVAVNCELSNDDVVLAQHVAATIRERDGGLPGVRALGLMLAGAAAAQVSMNLVALEQTGVEAACTAVRDAVEAAGATLRRVELVGLIPAGEIARCSPQFLAWSGLSDAPTIESRFEAKRP